MKEEARRRIPGGETQEEEPWMRNPGSG